jgi:hypothetical protein
MEIPIPPYTLYFKNIIRSNGGFIQVLVEGSKNTDRIE